MDKVKSYAKKALKVIGRCIKKLKNTKIADFSLLTIIGALIVLIIVIKVIGGVIKGDRIDYPIIYNSSDGDLVLVNKNDKSEDDTTKLSNNDNTDNVKYANTSDRYILFKKGDSLHLYDSKKKDSTTKIVGNVYSYYFTPNDEYIVALNKSSELYTYKLGSRKDAEKIDKNVSSIVDYNDNYIMYISDGNLYVRSLKASKDDRRKVTDEFSSNYVNQSRFSEDGKKIVYINKDGDLIVQKMNAKEEIIASNVTSFNINKNASKIYYQTNDEVNALYYYDGRSHKIDENIYRVFEVDVDNEMIVYGQLKDNVYTLKFAKGNKEAVTVEKDLDFIYSAMIFKDKSIYYVVDDYELKYSKISGDKTKKSKSVVDSVSVSSIKEFKDGIYFIADVDDNGGTLYKTTQYKARKIDTEIIYTGMTVAQNGKDLYYFKEYNNKSGELYKYNGSKSKLIDKDVYSFSFINNSLMYYIKDFSTTNNSGDLYRYTGKSKKVATDVKKITGINYIYSNDK